MFWDDSVQDFGDGTYGQACDAILAERSARRQADAEFLRSLGVKPVEETNVEIFGRR
jgi:hypothetical protein